MAASPESSLELRDFKANLQDFVDVELESPFSSKLSTLATKSSRVMLITVAWKKSVYPSTSLTSFRLELEDVSADGLPATQAQGMHNRPVAVR